MSSRTRRLSRILAGLEARLPAGKKLRLIIDEKAFGKQAPRLAAARLRVAVAPRKTTLSTLLRIVLARLDWPEELDLAVRPTGIEITRPRLASHRARYDIRAVLKQLPRLRPNLPLLAKSFAPLGPDFEPDAGVKGPDLLVSLLFHAVSFQPWETVQVLNAARLDVLCSPRRHEDVADLLALLLRMADNAVVMNARLYEVDQAFYQRHIAPLFARAKGALESPRVLPIGDSLLKRITRQKLLLESEEAPLLPQVESIFLARQSVFRFLGRSREGEGKRTAVGLAGVSFSVRPLVSRDRRYLRLHITQKSARLVGIEKSKALDPATGKEVELESPNLSRTTVTGSVEILDAQPILMPVEYRPPGKDGSGKVWLLVARPFIWMEEEVKELREEGKDLSGKIVWKSPMPEEEPKSAPPPRLASSDDVREVLQAILDDLLTDKGMKDTRDFYGTPKAQTFTLVDGDTVGWPRHFNPEVRGWKRVSVRLDPFEDQPRVLGIRIDRFSLKPKKEGMSYPIAVCFFNAGGSANGAANGGWFVYYEAKRVGKRWTVEQLGLFAP
jgi:hypothetical protein